MLKLEKVEYKRLQMSESKEKCSSLKQFKEKIGSQTGIILISRAIIVDIVQNSK